MIFQLVCLIKVRQLPKSINQVQLTLMQKSSDQNTKILSHQNGEILVQHLQGVVRDAPNRPPEDPHAGLAL